MPSQSTQEVEAYNAAFDRLRASHPESARIVEAYIRAVEEELRVIASENAWQAAVYRVTQGYGEAVEAIRVANTSWVPRVLEVEAAKKRIAAAEAEAALVLARNESVRVEARATVHKGTFSTPVILAVIPIASLVLTGLLEIVKAYFGIGYALSVPSPEVVMPMLIPFARVIG